jgi:hypothetical protein
MAAEHLRSKIHVTINQWVNIPGTFQLVGHCTKKVGNHFCSSYIGLMYTVVIYTPFSTSIQV